MAKPVREASVRGLKVAWAGAIVMAFWIAAAVLYAALKARGVF